MRSTKGAKSSGESSRSRDSGIDDNIRDCCSCRQSSVSSRDSYGWPGGRPVEAGGCSVRCSRCCSCAAGKIRRHRSSSPARRACSLKTRCSSHRSLPRHAHSHHDLRDDTETESEMSDSGPAINRGGSAHSSRRALYTAELFSNSLTPAHRSPHACQIRSFFLSPDLVLTILFEQRCGRATCLNDCSARAQLARRPPSSL